MLKDLKPGVSNAWLIFIAGAVWSSVGLMLCRSAYFWLALFQWSRIVPLAVAGIVLALLMNRFCFSGIARKNVARLSLLTGKTCIFAFQRWQSYLLICLMIMLGIAVKMSPIPRSYLAVLYTTIGGALLLSSLKYYRCLWQILGGKSDTCRPVTPA
jgi:hypothetical protein